jgi:radical SAM superfamily enzyme YgiQ (UPF0313 family)
MLKEINKKITVEQARHAFDLCREKGIRTYANMLYNLPNETEEDVLLSGKLLKELKPTVVGCGTTVPLLGTPLYEKYVHPRLAPDEYKIYNMNVYEEIVDERFRLSKHSLDLTKIVRNLNGRYSALRTLSKSSRYWSAVFTSAYFTEYAKGYLHMLLRPGYIFSRRFAGIARILLVKTIKAVDAVLFRGKIRKLMKRRIAGNIEN